MNALGNDCFTLRRSNSAERDFLTFVQEKLGLIGSIFSFEHCMWRIDK
jgi:hypothetical protein